MLLIATQKTYKLQFKKKYIYTISWKSYTHNSTTAIYMFISQKKQWGKMSSNE